MSHSTHTGFVNPGRKWVGVRLSNRNWVPRSWAQRCVSALTPLYPMLCLGVPHDEKCMGRVRMPLVILGVFLPSPKTVGSATKSRVGGPLRPRGPSMPI